MRGKQFLDVILNGMNILYKISGTVTMGDQWGKVFGFPTANIPLHKKIPEGIYASMVKINGKEYYAASFVGAARTFHRTDSNVESYIFDFNKNIYGKWITIHLLKKIRDNKQFDTVDELIAQMKKDVEEIKEYFSKEISR